MNAPIGLSLQGRRALITGAASGIGRATALRLAQAGAQVAINHLGQADAADALVQAIRAEGGTAIALDADVSQPEQVAGLVAAARQAFGGIDLLVNNAGVVLDKPFLDTSDADWRRVMSVDLDAAFYLCRAVLPGMRAQGHGVIVNIASDLGLLGRAQFAPYCAAKAGVIALTKSLALEFAPHIRVNAVAPGPVATAMVSLEHMSAEWIEKELDIPQHRLADPSEIADTVLFLASDMARFYTGQVLGPNGGSVMP